MPELFLMNGKIYVTRLLNFVLLALHNLFVSNLEKTMNDISVRLKSRSHSAFAFASPIICIFLNLYDNNSLMETEDMQRIESLLVDNETFSLDLVLYVEEMLQNEKPSSPEEKKARELFRSFVSKTEQLCDERGRSRESAQRKNSLREEETAGKEEPEEEFDEEVMCALCCAKMKDTLFKPCDHGACQGCATICRMNNEKCPYCNVKIEELIKITPEEKIQC